MKLAFPTLASENFIQKIDSHSVLGTVILNFAFKRFVAVSWMISGGLSLKEVGTSYVLATLAFPPPAQPFWFQN
jgi:hypothetical protein